MRTLCLSALLLIAAPVLAHQPMDINTASADQLRTLPGVNDDVAGKIIAGRPYTAQDQLGEQKIVDKSEYAKIRPLIVARPPKATGGQGAVERHAGPGPASDANVHK